MPAELQSRSGCRIGRDYPAPIVEHAAGVKEARGRIAAIRRRSGTRTEAQAVFVRHGSRKKPASPARRHADKTRQPTLPGLVESVDPAPAGKQR
jgi:deoxyribodipyrimidine photo-lyase